MNNFIKIILALVVIVSIALFFVTKQNFVNDNISSKPSIALSTFSLYDIAKHIAEDTFDVFMILPVGVDAHSFEPTPRLMVDIQKSALVVYSGAGLEPWTKNFEFTSKVIDMSKYVRLTELDADSHHEHGDSCSHGAIDPHYWLDIENMIIATNLIAQELAEILPANAQLYMKNRERYVLMLESIGSDYKKTLLQCKKETIIVNHNAFSYLSNKYGFNVEALSGLSPEAEPSAKNMVRLIEHVKEHKLKTIFFESFVSDKAMKSIGREAKVNVEVLHTLGNITAKDIEENLDFEKIMKMNLQKISKALECQ